LVDVVMRQPAPLMRFTRSPGLPWQRVPGQDSGINRCGTVVVDGGPGLELNQPASRLSSARSTLSYQP
jgi:hypothetical protein